MVANINHENESARQDEGGGVTMEAAAMLASAAQAGGSRTVPPAAKPMAGEGNLSRRRQVEALLAELLGMGLRKGFFGTMAMTLSFHDGNIQHVTKHIEQKVVR